SPPPRGLQTLGDWSCAKWSRGESNPRPLECDASAGCPECPRMSTNVPEERHFIQLLVDTGGARLEDPVTGHQRAPLQDDLVRIHRHFCRLVVIRRRQLRSRGPVNHDGERERPRCRTLSADEVAGTARAPRLTDPSAAMSPTSISAPVSTPPGVIAQVSYFVLAVTAAISACWE